MAKRIQVSDDAGTNWYTLPGNTGELTNEAGSVDDTIFGQDWQSMQSTLINWGVSANALYKGFAGYVAKVMKSGTPTVMTTEAMSLVSGKTYQVTATTKRTFDPATAVQVFDNAVDHTSDVESIDFLFGRVTFKSAYTVTGPVTVTAKYLPLTQVAKGRAFTLTQTANPIDTTDFETAQANSGRNVFISGLKTFGLDLSAVFAEANGYRALLESRAVVLLEIQPDGGGASVARGFFQAGNENQNGDVGALEEETVTFNGYVPQPVTDLMESPLSWLHTATTLSTAVQKLITAFLSGTLIKVRYLHDGTNGISGDAVVTDLTLAGGLEVMNEFSVQLQGSGAITPVP